MLADEHTEREEMSVGVSSDSHHSCWARPVSPLLTVMSGMTIISIYMILIQASLRADKTIRAYLVTLRKRTWTDAQQLENS